MPNEANFCGEFHCVLLSAHYYAYNYCASTHKSIWIVVARSVGLTLKSLKGFQCNESSQKALLLSIVILCHGCNAMELHSVEILWSMCNTCSYILFCHRWVWADILALHKAYFDPAFIINAIHHLQKHYAHYTPSLHLMWCKACQRIEWSR